MPSSSRIKASVSTDLQQPMPVGRVARQSRYLQPQHDSGSSQADLGNQPLKALPVGGGSSRLSEIAVKDDDAILGPAQCDGLLAQSVLAFSAFAILEHLAQR